MILKTVSLRNIRSYTNQTVEFPEGSVLLAGDIGAGKSSILQAAEFALFGPRRDSISGDAMLRKGEKSGEIAAGFVVDGRVIEVKRSLKKGPNGVTQDAGHIIVDGRKTECTPTELKARVLDLLGYPAELMTRSKTLVYRYTVYTPQEQMKQILFEDDEARVDTLRKVFGIDRYRRIAGNAALYIKNTKEKEKELRGKIADLEMKKKELSEQVSDLRSAMQRKEQLMPDIEKVRAEKAAVKVNLDDSVRRVEELAEVRKKREVLTVRQEGLKRQNEKARSDATILEAEIETLAKKSAEETEKKDLPPVSDVERGIADDEDKLGTLVQDKTRLHEQRKQVAMRIEDLKDRITKKEDTDSDEKIRLYATLIEDVKDRTMIERSMQALADRTLEVEKSIAETSSRIRQSEELRKGIKGLDVCPTCRQEVSGMHKETIRSEEEQRISKLSKELEALSDEKETASAKLTAYKKKLEHLAEKEKKTVMLKAEIDGLETVRKEREALVESLKELEKEKEEVMRCLEKADERTILALRKGIEERKGILKEIQAQELKQKEQEHARQMIADKENRKAALKKSIADGEREITSLEKEKAEIISHIVRLAPSEKESEEIRRTYDSVLEKEKGLEIRIGKAEQEIVGVRKIVELLEYDITQKEKAKETLVHLGNVQEWLEWFMELMGVVEKHVMAKLHTQFSELFDGWFNMLVDNDDMNARLDEDFSPIVVQNGYDTDIRHLSGGEKTSVALAYRLALNKVINDVIRTIKTKDLIILDEPTDGFSSEQLDKVRAVLDELDVRQTIIVSHEPKIESFVDHVVRVEKEGHVSRVLT